MYCVYLTKYSGTAMPQLYVGSSSVERVNNGYHGSVKSKKYREIWERELMEHPELFTTTILSIYGTRKEALKAELDFQIEHNVVKSDQWINQSLARANGFFGASMKGVPKSDETRQKISASMKGVPKSAETRKKLSDANSGEKNPSYGKPRSAETKAKLSAAQKGKTGQKHQASKLTDKERLEIIDLLKSGLFFQKEISSLYGVTQSLISIIKKTFLLPKTCYF